MNVLYFFGVMGVCWSLQSAAQPKPITPSTVIPSISPSSDDAVVEKLGARVARPQASADIVPAVRQAILLARRSADPRYLGQAQAMIGPLWSNPQASYDVATLQATIEQSRHEFAAASKTLRAALTKPAPSYAQAWLTLATIERVQGNYPKALEACQGINAPAAQLYAEACRLETVSLQGQWDTARRGFSQLLRAQRLPIQQAWLQSLMAENEERAGQTDQALKLYAASLAADADGYTALAYADALLRSGKPAPAALALEGQPNSDSVLIRRAAAYKALGDTRWQALAEEIRQRFAASAQRGGSQAGHAREQAQFELLVLGDAKAALASAQANLQLQREPLDWLLAVQSANQSGNSAEAAKLLAAAAKQGLTDARLK